MLFQGQNILEQPYKIEVLWENAEVQSGATFPQAATLLLTKNGFNYDCLIFCYKEGTSSSADYNPSELSICACDIIMLPNQEYSPMINGTHCMGISYGGGDWRRNFRFFQLADDGFAITSYSGTSYTKDMIPALVLGINFGWQNVNANNE